MSAKIVVATPIRSFGELISQALQELAYFPLLVAGSAEAITVARNDEFNIVVLDCKMPDPGTAQLAAELHAQIENLHIIFIHLDEGCDKGVSIDPELDVELPRPFYLPDLLEAVVELSAGTSAALFAPTSLTNLPENLSDIPSELAWLQDVNRAAQYLTRLSLEADAQAALIIQHNQIWAYAGQLSQAAAEELALFAGEHWANGDGNDLVRFVRLVTTNSEYMLYATGLGSGFVLALAFETEMPFSKMRAQTGELARRLTSPPETPLPEDKSLSVPEKSPPSLDIDDFSPEDWIPEDDFSSDLPEDHEDHYEDEAILERQAAMFEDLLASLDIPDPDGVRQAVTLPQTETVLDHPVKVEPPGAEKTSETQPMSAPQVETDPKPITSTEVQLEPETPSVHDLAYACVLLPRLPTHHLTGELPELLNREMMRLCPAFGWRLEHLAIRPQYLHWVVSVGPDISAAQVIREIRKHTSASIFESSSRLAKENPSGDFWAQGFMVIHGRRSLAGELMQDFIRQTRVRQGFGN